MDQRLSRACSSRDGSPERRTGTDHSNAFKALGASSSLRFHWPKLVVKPNNYTAEKYTLPTGTLGGHWAEGGTGTAPPEDLVNSYLLQQRKEQPFTLSLLPKALFANLAINLFVYRT